MRPVLYTAPPTRGPSRCTASCPAQPHIPWDGGAGGGGGGGGGGEQALDVSATSMVFSMLEGYTVSEANVSIATEDTGSLSSSVCGSTTEQSLFSEGRMASTRTSMRSLPRPQQWPLRGGGGWHSPSQDGGASPSDVTTPTTTQPAGVEERAVGHQSPPPPDGPTPISNGPAEGGWSQWGWGGGCPLLPQPPPSSTFS